MDRIEDIRLFLRVLDLGSISAAARTLELSPAVARQRGVRAFIDFMMEKLIDVPPWER